MMARLDGTRRPVATIALGAAAAATLAACSAPTQPPANDATLQQLRLDAQAVAGAEASGDLSAARRRLDQLRAELSAARGALSPGQVRHIQAAIALVAADLAPHGRRPDAPASSAPGKHGRATPARTSHADLRPDPVSVPPAPVYAPSPHPQPNRPSHVAGPKHGHDPAPPPPGPKGHGPDPHKHGEHKPAPHGPADHRPGPAGDKHPPHH